MRVRALDADHDWQFGKGRNDYKQNLKAVVQNIDTRLSSFLGDCFFAMSEGVDWFNLLGAKSTLALELALSTVILNTLNVTSLATLNVNLSSGSRRCTITYEVNTVYGRAAQSFSFDTGATQ